MPHYGKEESDTRDQRGDSNHLEQPEHLAPAQVTNRALGHLVPIHGAHPELSEPHVESVEAGAQAAPDQAHQKE